MKKYDLKDLEIKDTIHQITHDPNKPTIKQLTLQKNLTAKIEITNTDLTEEDITEEDINTIDTIIQEEIKHTNIIDTKNITIKKPIPHEE